MSRWRYFLLWLCGLIYPAGGGHGEIGSCANRRWRRFMAGPIEATISYRDTRMADGYSREELFEMLETVRREETAQGWRVPDRLTPIREEATKDYDASDPPR